MITGIKKVCKGKASWGLPLYSFCPYPGDSFRHQGWLSEWNGGLSRRVISWK